MKEQSGNPYCSYTNRCGALKERMTVKEQLEEFDLYDQSIIRHGMLMHIRDYEIIGYLYGDKYDTEIQYVFKGCLTVGYRIKVDPKSFSMDERLLDLNRQNESDYPDAFVWGARYAVVYPGWTLTSGTEELNELEKRYKLKLYQIHFETNAYDLTLIFHSLDILENKKIQKK